MKLLLVRHASAVEAGTPGIADEARPLTPEGIRRFEEAARGLARVCPAPDVLLTSPLLRARQTAEIAAAAWGGPPVRLEPSLASGDFDAFAQALAGLGDAELVAAFGHEPTLSGWLARLLGSRAGERFAFKKGGAALLELRKRHPEGTLLFAAPPRVLRALGGAEEEE
ncbi:MAG: histidine phosphatase family protein [Vicinamibacteria bacterium]